MASERQIAANRMNSARSCGPRSESGRMASRANALKHGLACETIDVEASQSPVFQARRQAWAAEYRPEGELQDWALDRVVASSFRIERCERVLETVVDSTSERAQLAWDQDRSLEAAKLGSRLSKNPVLISRKLETTWHGVDVMLDLWTRLEAALKEGEEWNEEQSGIALDLLGVAPEFRTGKVSVEDPAGGPTMEYCRKLAVREMARLVELQVEALMPLEQRERDLAASGASAMLSVPGKLVLRYEREAWKRYRDGLKLLNEPNREAEPKKVAPSPAVATTPAPPAAEAEAGSRPRGR